MARDVDPEFTRQLRTQSESVGIDEFSTAQTKWVRFNAYIAAYFLPHRRCLECCVRCKCVEESIKIRAAESAYNELSREDHAASSSALSLARLWRWSRLRLAGHLSSFVCIRIRSPACLGYDGYGIAQNSTEHAIWIHSLDV